MIDRVELVFEPEDLPLSKKGGGRGRVLPRKNVYFAVDRKTGGYYLTPEAREFRRAVRAKAIEAGVMTGFALEPAICSGWWRLDLLTFAPRKRDAVDVLLPFVDSDGCLSPVKDALVKCTAKLQRGGPELGGVLDRDERVVADSTAIAYRPGRPGLIVRLTRVRDPQQVLAERWPGVRFIGVAGGPSSSAVQLELDDDDA